MNHRLRHGPRKLPWLRCHHGPVWQCRSHRSAWTRWQHNPETHTWPQVWTPIPGICTTSDGSRNLRHRHKSYKQQGHRPTDPDMVPATAQAHLDPRCRRMLEEHVFFHASSELTLESFLIVIFGYFLLAFLVLVSPSTIPGQLHFISHFTHPSACLAMVIIL